MHPSRARRDRSAGSSTRRSSMRTGRTPGTSYDRALAVRAVLQDARKRSASKLVERQAALRNRFRLGDRAAIQRAQEIAQQPLPGCRVVEQVADDRGLRRLLDEI